jgi:hypothetical protein
VNPHDPLNELPVAIIGAGPVGLAAAANLVGRGLAVRIYESGESAAANVLAWAHVRLFSPWRFNLDPAAAALLADERWTAPPEDELPTGRELYDRYLAPLAATPRIQEALRTRTRVVAIARQGLDKLVSRDRGDRPFALRHESAAGPRTELARAVIDASGTWKQPNPMGADGLPAIGEARFSERIAYGVPDVLGRARETYAGRRVAVIGGGHSAANALLDLARLAEREPAMQLVWAVRSRDLTRVFGGGAGDQLPARGKLGSDLKALVAGQRLRLVTGFSAQAVEERGDGLVVSGRTSEGQATLGPVDRIVVATGQRPDLALTQELRLDLDPWLECPRALGPEIDPNLHSCGSVPSHGYRELAHPEPGFFTAGVKSYGRAPTFLMATGYEQVRSIAAYLAGDLAAANDVRLVLPETGVCSADFLETGTTEAGCCGGPAPAEVEACCAADAQAKAQAKSGCGCSAKTAPEASVRLGLTT